MTAEREESAAQARLVEPARDEQNSEVSLFAVVTTHADAPHAKVEGVFAERGPADELMDDCRSTTSSPHPTAWALWKLTPGEEPEMIDP